MSPMFPESEPPRNTTHRNDKELLCQLCLADMARTTKELESEPRPM